MGKRLDAMAAMTDSGAIIDRQSRWEYSYKDDLLQGTFVVEPMRAAQGRYVELIVGKSIDEMIEASHADPKTMRAAVISNIQEALSLLQIESRVIDD